MGDMDKYSRFLDQQQSHISIFESKNFKDFLLNENKMAKKLKSLGWKQKDVDDETSKHYFVFHHPDKKENHHEYYIDRDGDHFYHFYHNGNKTNIDAGLKHTFGDHLKHMKFNKMNEEMEDFGPEPLEENMAAVAARVVGGLSKIGGQVAKHAAAAAELDRAASSKIKKPVEGAVSSLWKGAKHAMGSVGHVDLLTHGLGSTGTLSLQAGFVKQKDANGRPTGDHKFNLRLRHDNWRTGQRTIRDIVGSEYKDKADARKNQYKNFKARFRYGRNQSNVDQPPQAPPGDQGAGKSSSQQAYDAFAHQSGADKFKK